MGYIRHDGRGLDEIRPVKVTTDYIMHPDGSVLIEMGNTKVICTAFVEEKTAQHLKGTGNGWVTAEYSMLPGSTGTRKMRDAVKGKIEGRTQEIQRLIGRSLRSAVDMTKIGERTIWIDCDVIQADGGTRTASITGAFIALTKALQAMKARGSIDEIPLKSLVSAISVGIVEGSIALDLCYIEDSAAWVDMNIVMTDRGELIEVQGTAEENPFTRIQMQQMIDLAEVGCKKLFEIQREALGI